jgi:hypothetical protein
LIGKDGLAQTLLLKETYTNCVSGVKALTIAQINVTAKRLKTMNQAF